MHALETRLSHLVRDRVVPVACQAIDAGPDKKMRAEFLGCTEQLVYAAFPVADVDASRRIAKQFGRLAHVLEPSVAFLLLDGHLGRVDLALERRGAPALRRRSGGTTFLLLC